ncbi:YbaB/EbfC family nucleoid-associated protein [Amycolatopsis magusensis]|uniref:YbaB/EbfC family nucleoid-associated protein n=1 Tax=Amycolatopsis magusensis TaxID=882444 RepID=UPI003C306036
MTNGLGAIGRDPAEVEARIDQWAQGFADKAQRYQAAQAQVEQIRTSASSPDGTVRVTVRADGSVTDLQFSERIRQIAPSELSAMVLRTMQTAQSQVVGQVGETMQAELGDEDQQTRSLMMEELRSRFPEPEPEGEEAAGAVSEKWDYDDRDDTPPPPPPAATPPPAPPAPPIPPAAGPTRRPNRRPEDGDDDIDPDFDPLRD